MTDLTPSTLRALRNRIQNWRPGSGDTRARLMMRMVETLDAIADRDERATKGLRERVEKWLALKHVRSSDREADFVWEGVTDQAFRRSFENEADRLLTDILAPAIAAAAAQARREGIEEAAQLIEYAATTNEALLGHASWYSGQMKREAAAIRALSQPAPVPQTEREGVSRGE